MYNYEQRVNKVRSDLEKLELTADLTNYENSKTTLEITCTRCGNKFTRNMATLMAAKYPCDGCRAERKSENHRKRVADMFTKRFNDLGLNKDYSIVEIPELIRYPAKFKHLACGNIINTSLQNLSRTTKNMKGIGSGCEYCSGKHTYTEEEVKAYMTTERPTYEFIRTYMNNKHHLHVIVKHLRCGEEKDLQVNYFMSKGEGCRYCNVSGGEEMIMYALDKLCVTYEHEKAFDDLVNPKTGEALRYDFYIPSKNLLIEYDGTQHTNPMSFSKSKENFLEYQYRDLVKNEYAKINDINLIRISYKIFGSKLLEYIKELVK